MKRSAYLVSLIFFVIFFAGCATEAPRQETVFTEMEIGEELHELEEEIQENREENSGEDIPWKDAVIDLIVKGYSLIYAPESVQMAVFYGDLLLPEGFSTAPIEIPHPEYAYTDVPSAFKLYDLGGTSPILVIQFELWQKSTVFQYQKGAYIKLFDFDPYFGFYETTGGDIILASHFSHGPYYYYWVEKEGGYKLEEAVNMEIETLAEISPLQEQGLYAEIENLALENNALLKDWRYVYAEYLENYCAYTPKYNTYALYDFDVDGIPELILSAIEDNSYMEPTIITTLDDGSLKENFTGHNGYTYNDTNAYIYYNPYYDIRGIVAPYSGGGLIPLFYMDKDGNITVEVLLSQFMDTSAWFYWYDYYADGTLVDWIRYNEQFQGYTIEGQKVSYILMDLFKEEKRLEKYALTTTGIYQGVYGYETPDPLTAMEQTSQEGFKNFFNEAYAKLPNEMVELIQRHLSAIADENAMAYEETFAPGDRSAFFSKETHFETYRGTQLKIESMFICGTWETGYILKMTVWNPDKMKSEILYPLVRNTTGAWRVVQYVDEKDLY